MKCFTMTFFPWLQTSEDGAVVWLVSISNNAVATDSLIRLDSFGLRENLFHLLEYFARTCERSARRQLYVDSEDALIFIGNEARWNCFCEEGCSNNDESNDHNSQNRSPDKQPRHVNITVRRNVEYLVESAKEGPKWSSHRLRLFQQQGTKGRRERQCIESRK